MKLWWARNWLPLIAAAVLVPLTIGITFGSEWWNYFSGRPVAVTSVEHGTSTLYAKSEFTVGAPVRIAANSAAGRRAKLPVGSELVVVTVSIDPKRLTADGSSTLCTMELEELRGNAVTRHWNDANFDPIVFSRADGVEFGCNSEQTSRYRASVPFVVPAGAGKGGTELALLLYSADVLPQTLRVRL